MFTVKGSFRLRSKSVSKILTKEFKVVKFGYSETK